MSHPECADLAALIRALTEAEVSFVVVGGAAAVLHGAPVTTLDLDIVPERSEANIDQLDPSAPACLMSSRCGRRPRKMCRATLTVEVLGEREGSSDKHILNAPRVTSSRLLRL